MPKWNASSLPAGFRKKHNTKVGTWAKLTIFKGSIKFCYLDEEGKILDTAIFDTDSSTPFIEPQAWHKVEPFSEDLECQLAFYCQPEDYYSKRYQLSSTHSEVVELVNYLNGLDKGGTNNPLQKSVLDFGCGSGRNSLYLQKQGFDVTAFDKNTNSIATLESIVESENLVSIKTSVADATHIDINETYDLVISTVVLMFLDGESIPDIMSKIQQSTNPSGYNLIVTAMDSSDYPMSAHDLPFDFGFKPGELASYYDGWNIIKYNEDVGHLHRLGKDGNPIALRFATLVAQKL